MVAILGAGNLHSLEFFTPLTSHHPVKKTAVYLYVRVLTVGNGWMICLHNYFRWGKCDTTTVRHKYHLTIKIEKNTFNCLPFIFLFHLIPICKTSSMPHSLQEKFHQLDFKLWYEEDDISFFCCTHKQRQNMVVHRGVLCNFVLTIIRPKFLLFFLLLSRNRQQYGSFYSILQLQ